MFRRRNKKASSSDAVETSTVDSKNKTGFSLFRRNGGTKNVHTKTKKTDNTNTNTNTINNTNNKNHIIPPYPDSDSDYVDSDNDDTNQFKAKPNDDMTTPEERFLAHYQQKQQEEQKASNVQQQKKENQHRVTKQSTNPSVEPAQHSPILQNKDVSPAPAPAPVLRTAETANEGEKPIKPAADDRKARARQAVEDRKRKAREAVARRKARTQKPRAASGSDNVGDGGNVSSQQQQQKEDTERTLLEVERLEKENSRQREKDKLLELEDLKRREEIEQLRREEEEMLALEEELKREEEEAKKMAAGEERQEEEHNTLVDTSSSLRSSLPQPIEVGTVTTKNNNYEEEITVDNNSPVCGEDNYRMAAVEDASNIPKESKKLNQLSSEDDDNDNETNQFKTDAEDTSKLEEEMERLEAELNEGAERGDAIKVLEEDNNLHQHSSEETEQFSETTKASEDEKEDAADQLKGETEELATLEEEEKRLEAELKEEAKRVRMERLEEEEAMEISELEEEEKRLEAELNENAERMRIETEIEKEQERLQEELNREAERVVRADAQLEEEEKQLQAELEDEAERARLGADLLEEAERLRTEEVDRFTVELEEAAERLKLEEQLKIEAKEAVQFEEDNEKAEEALQVLERFAKEEKLKAEVAHQAMKQFVSSNETEEAVRLRMEEVDRSTVEYEEMERLKEGERLRIETEEAARFKEDNKKAEEALQALECFAKEEKRKAEEAHQAMEQFVSLNETEDTTSNVQLGSSAETEVDPFADEPDLDDLLDGSLNESAFLNAALDDPVPSSKKSPVGKTDKIYPTYESPTLISNPMDRKRGLTKPKQRFISATRPKPSARSVTKKETVSNLDPKSRQPQTRNPSRRIPKTPKRSPIKPPKAMRNQDTFQANNLSLAEDRHNLIIVKPKVSSPMYNQTVSETPSSVFSPSRSVCSTESECTIMSVPPSPFRRPSPGDEQIPICKNTYITKLHPSRGGCQVCIFKLSERENDQYENRGRHLRVAQTAGGCLDCNVFPSEEEEDCVRLCKQCFFDTHLIRPRQEKAFSGNGALSGVQHNSQKYSPGKKRYMNRNR